MFQLSNRNSKQIKEDMQLTFLWAFVFLNFLLWKSLPILVEVLHNVSLWKKQSIYPPGQPKKDIFLSLYSVSQVEHKWYKFKQFGVVPRNVIHEEMSQEKMALYSGELILRMVPVVVASVHGGVVVGFCLTSTGSCPF